MSEISHPLPLIGVCALSGTGKTTLLTRLLPLLVERGLRVATVKHAHHGFDFDRPGKDSFRLREAGAAGMVIISSKRMGLIEEFGPHHPEPRLANALRAIDPDRYDMILVEGFKHEAYPKLELHRPSLGHPPLFSADPHIVAVATDGPIAGDPPHIPQLDLNDPVAIRDFMLEFLGL